MAIIVQHQKNQNYYVVIGTGFGIYKSSRSNTLLGIPHSLEEEDHFHLVAVSDREGCIKWFYSEDLIVVEIEGQRPSDFI